MASELGKERWSVLNDRGVAASGLTHEDARRLVHRLAAEGRHGLCIVTDEAAKRMGGIGVQVKSPGNSTTVQD
jgi:hypothetical protein